MKRPSNRAPAALGPLPKPRGGLLTPPEVLEEKEGPGLERTKGVRKKGMAARSWLHIDQEGKTEVIEADKYAIMRRVSIPARDLRILDPLLSYPSTVLGREKAIVVNLEHIKCIITADEVLLLNWRTPEVASLVDDLQHRLPVHLNALGEQMAGDGGGGLSATEIEAASYRSERGGRSRSLSPPPTADSLAQARGVQRIARAALGLLPRSPPESRLQETEEPRGPQRGGPNALPFEFRALEACLEAACGALDKEATKLELEAYPALDELTATISTLNLERVRQIKSRLVTISGRVQKVRDELEQLLDDDEDMNEMYLTDKKHQELGATLSHSSSGGGFSLGTPLARDLAAAEEGGGPPREGRSAATPRFSFRGGEVGKEENEEEEEDRVGPGEGGPAARSLSETRSRDLPRMSLPHRALPPRPSGSDLEGEEEVDSLLDSVGGGFRGSILGRPGDLLSSSSSETTRKSLDVEELEMLLEAYFVQIEGTLNKLSSLREYVDDTEDYINIMLDDKQNSLLQMNVFLTTLTLFISMFVVVTGVFGMNIPLWLFDPEILSNYGVFYWIVGGCTVGVIVLFAAVILYIRHKGLLG